MGLLDAFRKRKIAKVDNDPDRHYADSRDYFEEVEKEGMVDCPECARAQRHAHLVQSEGEGMECPECHYTLRRGGRI